MRWGRREPSLVDVLAAALERDDPTCGPPVDLWRAVLEPSDVQEQPQQLRTPPPILPVILGMEEPPPEP